MHEDRTALKDAISAVAAQMGIMEAAVEKDYYITLVLRLLSKKIPYIVFKGGTSLSKCYNAIRRFSEDIDITIGRSISQSERKNVKEAIKETASELGMTIINLDDTRSKRDYNQYRIAYDSVLTIQSEAVKPVVVLETSYVEISFPTVEMAVTNYIGEMMQPYASDIVIEFALDPFTMKVQSIERTLIDKVFALCDYYLSGKVEKHSRHIYDVYKLLNIVNQDENFMDLVAQVRKAREGAPICLSAKNEVNVNEILHAIVDGAAYKHDYETLTALLLDEKIPYDVAIQAVKTIADNWKFEE